MIRSVRERLLTLDEVPYSAAADRDGLTEADLVRAACADPECFAPLYRRYAPRIYAYCASRMNPQEAEDLTSQVFARALSGLDNYRGGSVAVWLFRIAHNAVVSHYRHNRHRPAPVSLEALELDIPDERMTVAEHIARSDQWRMVCEQVAALSNGDRELLALWLDGELSAGEIGVIVGKKAGTVRVRLHRIIRRLRERCVEALL